MIALDSRLFYSINVGLSSLNLLLLVVLLVLSAKSTIHMNLKLLLLNLAISFSCIVLSNFLTSIIHLHYLNASMEAASMPTVESSLMSESSSDSVRTRTVSVAATVTVTPTVVALRMNHNVEQVFLAISNYGVNLAPITFLTILVERAMATAYSKVYERLHSTAMQAVLVLIGHVGSVATIFCFNYLRIIYYFQAIANSSVVLLCLIFMFILYVKNKSLRHLDFYSDVELSQRFQVTENIRTLAILLPLVSVGLLFSFSSSVAGSIQLWISSSATQLRNPINHLIMNLYITFAFFIVLHQDRPTRRRLFHALAVWRPRKRVHEAAARSFKRVRNAFGERIVDQDTADNHFTTLQWMWNKAADKQENDPNAYKNEHHKTNNK